MKTLRKVLTIISCLCFSLAISLNVFGASATTVGGVTINSFTMENGAWIRVDKNSGNGIKFNAFLDTETYDTLEGLENATVNYGMVIVPNDLLPEGGITVDMLKSDANHFVTEEQKGCDCGKKHYAIVEYETLTDAPNSVDNKILRGSIVNIQEGNVVRPYTAVGYIEYVNGATTEYVLADYAGGDIANSTRSMAYVAQKAIDAGQDADGSIKAKYITPYTTGDYANKFPYTVNHYLNGKDQAPVEVETLYGTLGETVTAKHILNSTVENAAENYKSFRLCEIDNSKSTSSSVLYADGKTVLNVYYKEMDTVFYDTILPNEPGYKLIGANSGKNKNGDDKLPGGNAEYLDTLVLGGETKTAVAKITTTVFDAYTSGKFNLGLDRDYALKAKENGWSYIKFHMYIECDEAVSEINFLSKNKTVASNVPTGEWTDVIVPLGKINQPDTYIVGRNSQPMTYDTFYAYANFDGAYMWDGSYDSFLCTNSIKENSKGISTDITYYIDEISWGIDTTEPEITSIQGINTEMFEGTFTVPTVTATDDMSAKELLDLSVSHKLYKVVGDNREEVLLTDGQATLEQGSYVYVATVDDRIYADVPGENVTFEEVAFVVKEKPQELVIKFNDAKYENYVVKDEQSSYGNEPVAEYLDETALSSEGLSNGDLTITGGAIKFAAKTTGGYGAWFKFVLGSEEQANIANAVSITIRMAVKIDLVPSWAGGSSFLGEVVLIDGATGGTTTTKLTGFDRDTWVDVTLTADQLFSSIPNYFNGTKNMFWLNSDSIQPEATVTYYINSVTFNF